MAGTKNHDYHILPPDIWPLIGSLSALVFTSGMVLYMHEMANWQVVVGLGIADAREQGGGIARSGPDFEHAVARLDLGRLDHAGDDIGLRDRLPFADRQGAVVVGELGQIVRHEAFARDFAESPQDVVAGDTAGAQLAPHHGFALALVVGQGRAFRAAPRACTTGAGPARHPGGSRAQRRGAAIVPGRTRKARRIAPPGLLGVLASLRAGGGPMCRRA